MNNINKKEFNQRFAEFTKIIEKQESDYYYTKYLHTDIKTIISNCLYHFDFNSSQELEFADIEAELLIHFLRKLDKIKAEYRGNYYNLIFTCFTNKFRDLYRSDNLRRKHQEKLLHTWAGSEKLLQERILNAIFSNLEEDE